MENNTSSMTRRVKKSYGQGLLFSQHAVDRMNMPSRLITISEIKEVLALGQIIEGYPDDPRGPSCLIEYETSHHRKVCVVCAPKEDYLLIITTYPYEGEHE